MYCRRTVNRSLWQQGGHVYEIILASQVLNKESATRHDGSGIRTICK